MTRVIPEEPEQASCSSSVPDIPVISIEDLRMQLDETTIAPWTVDKVDEQDCIKFKLYDQVHSVAKYTVVINVGLEFTIYVFNWPIPDDHLIYITRKRCIKTVDNATELIRLVEISNLCEGLPQDDETKSVVVDPTWEEEITEFPQSTVIRHSTPKLFCESHFKTSVTFRSPHCVVILDTTTSEQEACNQCSLTNKSIRKAATRKKKVSSAPAKSKASLSACGPEKLRATVKASRLECKQLEERLKQLEARINEDGVAISQTLEKDILTIMGGKNLDATPHMKFFWQQQMKLLQTEKMGRRYHPQIIRFALSLHGKSPAAYRELQDSGALILPSERVLRDYKNHFKPKAGLNSDNIESLREKASSATGIQRYVALVMDEMKIQSNLVFDKDSGDLIGFVDLGDPETNYATLGNEDVMATHALAFW